ncbi:PAS domain S-box protein [Roseibacillus ishigakijimensis]|uniref:histidine kinase n=1 Tax=Roseibacillus ishigakijimensis TaxID=454146 RepID=A0A934VGV2_9BACT|nr:PAS domain S-box protein [Roseibacillus ishigakijimensis]MBK1833268.1 PAS domain S-box protein [Roseibacillus ishigakijimensis]
MNPDPTDPEYLIESTNAMFVVCGKEGRILTVNRMAELVTGYQREELIGQDWFSLLVPRDRYPYVWEAFLACRDEEDFVWEFENPILTKDGKERFVSWRNTPFQENGETVGTISFGIDITNQKRLEGQLLQAQKMEAVGRLAGGVAHDFNNMLTVILGQIEVILSSLPADHGLTESARAIEKAGRHSRDVTRQLLAFSRKQISSPEEIDLNEQIGAIRSTVSRLIGESINLVFEPGPDLWQVCIDPMQIEQIMMNLCINARDAMPDGGDLIVRTRNEVITREYSSRQVEVVPGDYVRIDFEDEGEGMAPGVLAHIFEPFYTTKECNQGTGLGLATVYGAVKQNGGFVNVYSEVGQGTTFAIFLPRSGKLPIRKVPSPAGEAVANTETILLVEDNELVREMTEQYLRSIGYRILSADGPTQGLRELQDHREEVDLLLTDVVMPEMNGVELSQKAKEIAPELKILFMSGYTENVVVRNGLLKDEIAFIQKPFSLDALADKIRGELQKA